jgi:prolyl 4-hydroxylase
MMVDGRTKLIVSLLIIVTEVNGANSQLFSRLTFAGGFGGASSSKSSKKPKGKKAGFSEMEKPLAPACEKPQLDKWGLPPPTEADLFPFMPPNTELIAASSQATPTKQDIEHALKDHLKLKLDRFDEHGIEKAPIPGRQPMKLRMIHQSPPVLAIDHFFSRDECIAVQDITKSDGDALQVASATFSPLALSKRTSTSWFCFYQHMPALLAKAHVMLGIPIQQMEEPQIVRYRTGEEFSWHYDEVPQAQLENGGQRVMTLLVYLNDVTRGGGTIFRDLKDTEGETLLMKPQQGSALVFFPAYNDGRADDRTLHKGEVAFDEKWITQMWIHQHAYRPAVPEGNTHEAAMGAIAQMSQALGYVRSLDELV